MKPIKGFEGKYTIDTMGNVTTVKTGIKRLASINKNTGYYVVTLYEKNKGYPRYIHRLVAQTFISNPEDKPEVNHINGIKTDNRVDNLEWVTRRENVMHAYDTGLTFQSKNLTQVDLVNALHRFIKGISLTALAKEYKTGLSRLSINLRAIAKLVGLSVQYEQVLLDQRAIRNTTVNISKRQKINQFDLDGIFIASHISLSAAARALGNKNSGNISNALNPAKSQKAAYGYIWRYSN